MAIYFIGDLHLWNKNQTYEGTVNHDGRPFETVAEMNKTILENHNKRVTNGDTTVFVGDMSMRGRSDELVALVAQMKGKKILVLGNHDDVSDYRYAKLFDEICPYKEMTISFGGKAYKIVVSHYPILMWNGQHRGTILLYAHTHNSVEDEFFQKCIAEMNRSEELSLRRQGGQKIVAINTGCMMPYMNYAPRTLQEMLEGVECL